MQVISAVTAIQTLGMTNKIVQAASQPALAKSARTGHPQFGNGTGERENLGHPPSANGEGVTYDAVDRMVENGGGANQFVYSPVSQQPLAEMHGLAVGYAYIQLPGGAVAVYNSTPDLFQWNHADWLGSARLFSTTSRTAIPAMAYAPFGEGYAGGQQWIQFTGAGAWTVADNENDTGSLDDFTFRRYSPGQGRWISPDPAGLAAVDPSNPQSWNRYAYVMNNPATSTDPLGLFNDAVSTVNDCVTVPDCKTYYVDGMQVSGTTAVGLLSMDAAAQCPSSCSGFSNTGQYVQYLATAGSRAQGYVNFSDLQQSLYDANGTFYTPDEWQTYLNQTSRLQEIGQYNRLSGNLPTGGSIPPFNTNIPIVNGAHANFPYACQAGFNCGPGRYSNGVHVECAGGGRNCAAGSPLVAHDDTVSPWTGTFRLQDVLTGRFWEHGLIDLFYGQFCGCVFPH